MTRERETLAGLSLAVWNAAKDAGSLCGGVNGWLEAGVSRSTEEFVQELEELLGDTVHVAAHPAGNAHGVQLVQIYDDYGQMCRLHVTPLN